MELKTFEVYKIDKGIKKRFGNPNGDGGYIIIDDIGNYDCLLSCGIANDISFEEEFLSIHNKTFCFAFDGTINNLPHQNTEESKKIFFIKKNIDSSNNLHPFLENYKDIFLKMDIEGHEFKWIHELKDEYLKNIKQIVIEFHLYTKKHWYHDKLLYYHNLFKKINKNHALVHLHVNNCKGCQKVEGKDFPMVFECTYIRKEFIEKYELSEDPIPSNLDKKNTNNPEIYLKGYPFNNL